MISLSSKFLVVQTNPLYVIVMQYAALNKHVKVFWQQLTETSLWFISLVNICLECQNKQSEDFSCPTGNLNWAYMVGQIFLVFSLTRNPPKQRLRRVLLPTHKHRNGSWEILYLSSVRPRFSISLVTSAISSFSLWVQTEREGKEVMKQKGEGEGIIILIVFFFEYRSWRETAADIYMCHLCDI